MLITHLNILNTSIFLTIMNKSVTNNNNKNMCKIVCVDLTLNTMDHVVIKKFIYFTLFFKYIFFKYLNIYLYLSIFLQGNRTTNQT